jgi:hypothetical protein
VVNVEMVRAGVQCAGCGEGVRGLRKGLCNRCYKAARRQADRGRTITCGVCGLVKKYCGSGDLCSACKQRRYYKPKAPRESAVKAVTVSDEDRTRFAEEVLPVVQRHAGWKFRHRRDDDDLVAEAMAVAWGLFLRELRLGRDPFGHAAGLVVMACRQASCYRRLCGTDPVDDALSPRSRVGVVEYFGREPDGSVFERFGVEHDPTVMLEAGMSPQELLDLL